MRRLVIATAFYLVTAPTTGCEPTGNSTEKEAQSSDSSASAPDIESALQTPVESKVGPAGLESLSKAQRMYFDLLLMSSFNAFDGKRVAGDLLKNRELWQSLLMTRSQLGIILRDLPDGEHNVDTLYVLAHPGREDALRHLADTWSADEIEWIQGEDAIVFMGSSSGGSVLVAWWD